MENLKFIINLYIFLLASEKFHVIWYIYLVNTLAYIFYLASTLFSSSLFFSV